MRKKIALITGITGQDGSYTIISGMALNNINGNTFYAVKFDTQVRIQVRQSVVDDLLLENYSRLLS